jgi:hypothetical protein
MLMKGVDFASLASPAGAKIVTADRLRLAHPVTDRERAAFVRCYEFKAHMIITEVLFPTVK